MFAVGVAILLGFGDVNDPVLGVILMVLGTGAVFGRETFVELVGKLLLTNERKDADGEDDESGDREIGIDRPSDEDEVKGAEL
jgi:hypothetical protein